MKTTNEQVQRAYEHLAKITGYQITSAAAKEAGYDKYLWLENSSSYGGYRLVLVHVETGAHYGAFGGNGCESRLKAPVMLEKLRGIIEGIKFVRQHETA